MVKHKLTLGELLQFIGIFSQNKWGYHTFNLLTNIYRFTPQTAPSKSIPNLRILGIDNNVILFLFFSDRGIKYSYSFTPFNQIKWKFR